MAYPHVLSNANTWLPIKTAPNNERILVCEGKGDEYRVYDVLWPDARRKPDGWMPRPSPAIWVETAEAIEKVLGLPSGSIISPPAKHRGSKAKLGHKLFCWIARNRHGYGISDIARAIKRHHTTVLNNANSIEQNLDAHITVIEEIDAELRQTGSSNKMC